jgi:hypothetical protein
MDDSSAETVHMKHAVKLGVCEQAGGFGAQRSAKRERLARNRRMVCPGQIAWRSSVIVLSNEPLITANTSRGCTQPVK